ncbi:hypothetical protein U9M48_008092 [Paspalum notatum var. saurae]|uniref:Uncharacterized protein n=1 Tax=Paspalum notatum var. saurae TaxID=547442 RepID=A0AAQ3WCL7_PASNO
MNRRGQARREATAAPFVYCRSTTDGNSENGLLKAALDGDLGRIKGIIRKLGMENGGRLAVKSFHKDGFGLLHCAACQGHLEVCKYLVEELGCDPNMEAACEGLFKGGTPFMASAQSDDISTVKYLLDHGADLMKADIKGCTVLHHAVSAGSCKVTEFLLSKGIPVDIDCGHGTPLYHAATNEQDKTLKILLDHHANAGADVNGKGSILTPLLFATQNGGYTDFVRLLLKAGANPNISDDLGRLPIELAAIRECKEEIEMLLPLTSPIPNIQNWSVDGVISYAKSKNEKPLDKGQVDRRKGIIKSQANLAFKRKDYGVALKCYTLAINIEPDAMLYSNRSLCKLRMGDGEGALSDAYLCRMMRPDWAKACYREAAAHMILKEYKQAYDALRNAQKLDPGNDEIERELRKAMELMNISPAED